MKRRIALSLLLVCMFALSFGSLHAQNTNNTTRFPAANAGNTQYTAADCAPDCPQTNAGSQATNFDLKIKLNNPLKVNTIQDAIRVFMNAVVKIAIPFIIVFFIWSGLNFILARGNPEKLKVAKKMFWNTVIGALLILGAWTITNALVGTINSIAS